jgi:hypothetical protein
MKKTITTFAIALFAASAIAGVAVGWDIYKDRQHIIEIEEVLPLYNEEQPYLTNMKAEKFILPGERLNVLRIKYTKDFMLVKVETGDGIVGWIYDSDKVKLHRK